MADVGKRRVLSSTSNPTLKAQSRRPRRPYCVYKTMAHPAQVFKSSILRVDGDLDKIGVQAKP